MRDIVATNIENPGNSMWIADEQRIIVAERGSDSTKFPLGYFSGKPAAMQGDFAKRRRRAVRPDRVDWFRLHGNEFGARGLAGVTAPLWPQTPTRQIESIGLRTPLPPRLSTWV